MKIGEYHDINDRNFKSAPQKRYFILGKRGSCRERRRGYCGRRKLFFSELEKNSEWEFTDFEVISK